MVVLHDVSVHFDPSPVVEDTQTIGLRVRETDGHLQAGTGEQKTSRAFSDSGTKPLAIERE